MKISLMGIISVIVSTVILVNPAHPDESRWLWATPNVLTKARHLVLTVTPAPPGTEANQALFQCNIASDFSFRGALVELQVRDTRGNVISEGGLPLDIRAGSNTCTITLDSSALPLGNYEAVFSIGHTSVLSKPSHTFTLRIVSAGDLVERRASFRARADELSAALDKLEEGGQAYPYLRLKSNIVNDVLVSAKEHEGQHAWESLEEQLRYIDKTLNTVHAGIVFSDTTAERSTATDTRSQNNLLVQDGAFIAGTSPVFLFGGALLGANPDDLAQLHRYQLNAAAVTLKADANPSSPQSPAALAAELTPFFDAAEANNVSVAVQLTPNALAPALMEAAPPLSAGGRAFLGDPEMRAYWTDYLAAVGPALRDQPMLLGVSLAYHPEFHFTGEDVKAGFLDFIRANYADRLTLNRAWRSHLATLDEIELWSENPYDVYQTHRPFRFDWQTYHQRLGNNYFQWSRDTAQAELPHVPLMVTLPDTAFNTGEALYSVDRERLSQITQIAACTGGQASAHSVYAFAYPWSSAHYALLRSFDHTQPVLNLNSTWDLPERATEEETYRFVHSALWEAVMSGLSGATIPMDSLLFRRPEALEAFATASLDVNRLAPIIVAFQNAPTDVGILFSQSSKVFDNGEPHLKSALHAYEGTSFGGYHVRFVTETQCENGILDDIKILVIPDTPAVSDRTFGHLMEFAAKGGTVARTGAPIPYNERGFSRDDLIPNTEKTVLVRGLNLPTEYLHAMDAASVLGTLPQIPRPVTKQGYPIEGVRSRYVEVDGEQYLYIVNLRKEPAYCTLATPTQTGRDLIQGEDVTFPTNLEPMVPMLIHLKPVHLEMTVSAVTVPE